MKAVRAGIATAVAAMLLAACTPGVNPSAEPATSYPPALVAPPAASVDIESQPSITGAPADTWQLANLVVRTDELPGRYDRDSYRHWDNVTACQTVRQAVLIRDAGYGSLTLRDTEGRITEDPSTACDIGGGRWVDPYVLRDGYLDFNGEPRDGEWTNPADADVDHVVSLGDADRSGARTWAEDRKRDYANDQANLLTTLAASNRSKSDRPVGEWRPQETSQWCRIASIAVDTKTRYQLTVTAGEKAGLTEMIATCDDPPEPSQSPLPAPQPDDDAALVGPSLADVVYASCNAVRAAGAAPITAGDPGWDTKFDRDGNGVGCQ